MATCPLGSLAGLDAQTSFENYNNKKLISIPWEAPEQNMLSACPPIVLVRTESSSVSEVSDPVADIVHRSARNTST